MAMTMTGEVTLPAERPKVWALLNDPEVLKSAIPGCQSLEKTGDNGFAAVVKTKIGPVSATFKGKVELSDIVPLVGYTIKGEGEGGIAGFAKGGAKVSLADAPGGTLLHYDVEATVGGKIAQLGSRLIDGVAKNMADKFFSNFAAAAADGVAQVGEANSASPSSDHGEAAADAAPKKSWFGRIIGMIHVSMAVNGRPASADVDPRTLLVQFLRENLRLTGTHVGCDTSQCGACVVHVDGRAIKSCTVLAASCEGAQVTTIEGLATNGKLHPMQQAFQDNHGLQCGFCTPGMIMAAVDLVNREGPNLDEAAIRHGLEGNICRCTGYHNIVKSIAQGAREMGAAATPQAAE